MHKLHPFFRLILVAVEIYILQRQIILLDLVVWRPEDDVSFVKLALLLNAQRWRGRLPSSLEPLISLSALIGWYVFLREISLFLVCISINHWSSTHISDMLLWFLLLLLPLTLFSLIRIIIGIPLVDHLLACKHIHHHILPFITTLVRWIP